MSICCYGCYPVLCVCGLAAWTRDLPRIHGGYYVVITIRCRRIDVVAWRYYLASLSAKHTPCRAALMDSVLCAKPRRGSPLRRTLVNRKRSGPHHRKSGKHTRAFRNTEKHSAKGIWCKSLSMFSMSSFLYPAYKIASVLKLCNKSPMFKILWCSVSLSKRDKLYCVILQMDTADVHEKLYHELQTLKDHLRALN